MPVHRHPGFHPHHPLPRMVAPCLGRGLQTATIHQPLPRMRAPCLGQVIHPTIHQPIRRVRAPCLGTDLKTSTLTIHQPLPRMRAPCLGTDLQTSTIHYPGWEPHVWAHTSRHLTTPHSMTLPRINPPCMHIQCTVHPNIQPYHPLPMVRAP